MTDVKDITIEQIKHLDSTPPEGSNPTSVMTMEAEVDVKPQDLKTIRPYFESHKSIPPDLSAEGQIVLHSFLACFDRQQSVKEGKIPDIMFGFEQVGIHPQITANGIKELLKKGYIELQAPDNTITTSIDSTMIEHYWVRYTQKLLDLVYC